MASATLKKAAKDLLADPIVKAFRSGKGIETKAHAEGKYRRVIKDGVTIAWFAPRTKQGTVALHSLKPQVERAIGGKIVKVDDRGAAAIGKKLAAVKVEAKKTKAAKPGDARTDATRAAARMAAAPADPRDEPAPSGRRARARAERYPDEVNA